MLATNARACRRQAPPALARAALALAVVAALGAPARAGVDTGVVVTGDGAIQPQLAAQIERWLVQRGRTLVPSPLPPDAITSLIDCFATENAACARGVFEKKARPSTMVFARADARNNPANGTRDVTLTMYLFERGRDTVAARKACERCTDQALRDAADDVLVRLLGAGAAPGHVKLTSTPPGAHIAIDGVPTGVTPLDWDLAPGPHKVAMTKPGYVEATREVVVVSGRTDPVAIALARPAAPSTRPGWALPAVVAGGAMMIGGGVLIAIHQSGGPADPPRVRDTRTAGIAVGVGGVVVAAVGAYFQWFRGGDEPRSTPTAALTAGGAVVGWAGRF